MRDMFFSQAKTTNNDFSSSQAKRVKVVTRLKDFSGRRRPVSLHMLTFVPSALFTCIVILKVSCLSWRTLGSAPNCLAIGHCSSEFLGSHEEVISLDSRMICQSLTSKDFSFLGTWNI